MHQFNDELLSRILSQDSEILSRPKDSEARMKELQVRIKEEQLRGAKLKNDSAKSDADLRQRYANVIFCFLALYMAIALVIVICCGIGCLHISDSVLMTMLGTTTANVVGLFAYVMKYLFPSKR